MTRVIIAGASEPARTKLSGLLASCGCPPFRCCASESELRRAVNACSDGVVILAGGLPGLDPDDLAWDYAGHIHILLIARPSVLDRCEAPEIARLTAPASARSVTDAVLALLRSHQDSLPKRTGRDRETVDQAKRLLMETQGLTEPQAHHYIQRHAMDRGIRMADLASQILAAEKKPDGNDPAERPADTGRNGEETE